LEFFRDGLPEKKLQLVGMGILLILLSPGPGYYSCFEIYATFRKRSTGAVPLYIMLSIDRQREVCSEHPS
jgi:hypothetical protein